MTSSNCIELKQNNRLSANIIDIAQRINKKRFFEIKEIINHIRLIKYK